mmetsp:Transcript_48733/g.114374  ORF Transcript_48733/g.114374 Transcript_48733/m.114374 type:complete len:261 (-) Transcript_48733:70-852(-)|eukprot:s2948_g2.t1
MFCMCCAAEEDKGELDLVPAAKVLEARPTSLAPEQAEESVETSKAKPMTIKPREEEKPKPLLEQEKAAKAQLQAPEDSKDSQKGLFKMKMRLAPAKQLGLELDDISELGPMIVNFAPGIVQDFNSSNEKKIEKYDRILAVNGEGGGSAKICEKLQQVLLDRGQELELSISRPQTYEVSMKREEKGLLGAKLTFKVNSAGILIEAVSKEGLFAEWNTKNPKNMILNGDHLIAVNGEALKGRDMVEQLKKEQMLTLTFLRWG